MRIMEENCENSMLRIEAEEAMKDVMYAVMSAELSKTLPSTEQLVYINVTTKESERYCVELSVQGFRIVGYDYDRIQTGNPDNPYFETIYALLDSISPGYRNTFGDALMNKLSKLQDEQRESEETGDS